MALARVAAAFFCEPLAMDDADDKDGDELLERAAEAVALLLPFPCDVVAGGGTSIFSSRVA